MLSPQWNGMEIIYLFWRIYFSKWEHCVSYKENFHLVAPMSPTKQHKNVHLKNVVNPMYLFEITSQGIEDKVIKYT